MAATRLDSGSDTSLMLRRSRPLREKMRIFAAVETFFSFESADVRSGPRIKASRVCGVDIEIFAALDGPLSSCSMN